MNQYVTGNIIKKLREERKLTQMQLAEKLLVSEKTISKWETGKGLPDIAILEDLAAALSISVIELMSGENVINSNRNSNLKKAKFYVCPICGNVITSIGEAMISCCGVVLTPLTLEDTDDNHELVVENITDEFFVSINHPMTKAHYISFMAAVGLEKIEIHKLYPESNAECRFKISNTQSIYYYCNRHGLFKWERKK